MKHTISTIICLLAAMAAKAQIGYQVSLLDQATGAPRVNEYVTVKIDLTDNAGSVICSETHSATTNEFGVISVTIGDADTFARMDWSRLPLWISATVEGVVIGKSQVLNVPVAEYAKRTGSLTKELLCSKTWEGSYGEPPITASYSFSLDGTYSKNGSESGTYEIDGNHIYVYESDRYMTTALIYSPSRHSIADVQGGAVCY